MRKSVMCLAFLCLGHVSHAQTPDTMLSNLTGTQDYVLKRISSFDETGGNADRRQIPAGPATVPLPLRALLELAAENVNVPFPKPANPCPDGCDDTDVADRR